MLGPDPLRVGLRRRDADRSERERSERERSEREGVALRGGVREGVNDGGVDGHGVDARKLVQGRCRCRVGNGIWLSVSDQGQGFDAHAMPDLVDVENLEAEHGRGIHLMKSAMDEVTFQQRGTEVHMCKRLARNPGVGPQSDSCGS